MAVDKETLMALSYWAQTRSEEPLTPQEQEWAKHHTMEDAEKILSKQHVHAKAEHCEYHKSLRLDKEKRDRYRKHLIEDIQALPGITEQELATLVLAYRRKGLGWGVINQATGHQAPWYERRGVG